MTPMILLPKSRLGRYQINSLLGAGGMGEVYLAEDTRLRRSVALKLLPAVFVSDANWLARFEREAYAVSSLNHPNILTIYEIGEGAGQRFIATEFIEGESLRERMSRGRLELGESLEISIQVASALAAAHAAGIVHRDIKPENIMLREDGYVKVLDFGLAKLTEEHKSSTHADAPTQKLVKTNPGVVMGTVAYMSPEQTRGLQVDARTDVWSLGVLIYEMLTGRTPFAGETTSDVIAAIIYKEAPPVALLADNCPAALERVLTKALQKEFDERYQSVKEMELDLKSLKRRLEFETEFGYTGAPGRIMETFSKQAVSYAHPSKVSSQLGGNRDALLLTEFTNLTGDAVFDGTLKMALAVTLEQSPFLDIFAEARVRQTLRLMGRSPEERVTRELGREICQRQGLKAYIAGTIASLGSVYVLTLEAINAQTDETIGRQLEQAESKEQVVKALGHAATGLREKLGESLSSIEQFDAALELTTSSLEALKVHSLGQEQTQKGKILEAIPFYERAIELDPNFAFAYNLLAVTYNNTNQPKLAAEYATKAFELRDRVSELEKLRITSFYYSYVTGELDKRIETLELIKRTFAHDFRAVSNLSDSYLRIGQFEKAAEAAREGVRLNRNNFVSHANLAESLLRLNRLTEAKEACELAFQQKLDSTYFHTYLYEIAFIETDAAAMTQHLAWFSGQPDEYVALHLQTGAAASRCRLRRSQDLSRRAIDLAIRSKSEGVAAQYAAEQALRLAFWSSGAGLPDASDERLKGELMMHVQHALRLERNKITLSRAALALSLAGEAAEADALTRELKTEYPKDTLINNLWLPLAEAAQELQDGQPQAAIESLEPTTRFERAAEFYPQYLRGLAFLRLAKGRAAALEFQEIIAQRGEAPLSALYPLAHIGAARALALAEEFELSRNAYREFLESWQDADADMPLLLAAKSEYERLK
ncbi:MAG TPA: protein kinase [Pyrinomonadaceae bacterium]|jgi:serine/threonine protein kinase